jgi:lincosamide nucleotidyltransferase A/C/D/E
MMSAESVLSLIGLLEVGGINVWLDGGWGVDALLGRQTRPHRDLDIVIELMQVPKLRPLLAARGFKDEPRDDTRPWNFVLADGQGLEVDVHAIILDAEGNGVYGPSDKGELYSAASLTGTGQVQGNQLRHALESPASRSTERPCYSAQEPTRRSSSDDDAARAR